MPYAQISINPISQVGSEKPESDLYDITKVMEDSNPEMDLLEIDKQYASKKSKL